LDGPIEYFVQAVDPTGNVALALDHGNPFQRMVAGQIWSVYLPLVSRNYTTAPDLVVERVVATSNRVQVIVKNQGNAAVTDEFYVMAYVDPSTAPSAVNQLWWDLGDQGAFWGVTASALPLEAGDVLTLTTGDAYYWPSHSRLDAPLRPGTPIYAQADAYNGATTHGAVLERHEILGEAYNNIGGPFYSTAGTAGSSPIIDERVSDRPRETGDLPPAPKPNILRHPDQRWYEYKR
jgi:hypothetical protein